MGDLIIKPSKCHPQEYRVINIISHHCPLIIPLIWHYLLGVALGVYSSYSSNFTHVATWVGDSEDNWVPIKVENSWHQMVMGKSIWESQQKSIWKWRQFRKGWSCAHRDFQPCSMKHISNLAEAFSPRKWARIWWWFHNMVDMSATSFLFLESNVTVTVLANEC